jgi:hypothetical protein
MEDVVGDE